MLRFKLSVVTLTLALVACTGVETTLPHKAPPQADAQPEVPKDAGVAPGAPPLPGREPPGGLALSDSTAKQRRERAQRCRPVATAGPIPLTPEGRTDSAAAASTSLNSDFAFIKDALDTGCKSCHRAPQAASGGFRYLDRHTGETILISGEPVAVPGIADAAKAMHVAVSSGAMPPEAVRQANPRYWAELASRLERWVDADTPELSASKPQKEHANPFYGLVEPAAFGDLGDCVPEEADVGLDPDRDLYFATLRELPKSLAMTDLFTWDTHELAKHGTLAYNVEYPLWSDYSLKLRQLHLPARASARGLKRDAVRYTASTKTFAIPENSRFYKTFFKSLRRADGTLVARPVETRIIVVRQAPREPLYGTYVWNDEGTEAFLLDVPYRDGTPWKDMLKEVLVDETSGQTRQYAIPARHRCQECHMGAEGADFVLGFTPLQINRRRLGEAGRDQAVEADELDQVARLKRTGFLKNVRAADLPRLEAYPSDRYLSEHALRAQGYLVGNCAHCHNPSGFAMQTHKVKLNLAAGQIFRFNTHMASKDFSNRKFVDHLGRLDQSYLYFRFAAPPEQQGLLTPMPLHTHGGPDCRGATLIGRWIMSFDPSASPDAIEAFAPKETCNQQVDLQTGPIAFTPEDFTVGADGSYAPRRLDWSDMETGMPRSYRELQLDDQLTAIIDREVAVDWFHDKSTCRFPDEDLAEAERKPWMVKPDGSPKRPWGQLYRSTPGAWFFSTTCSKCHGDEGAGDGEIGRALAQWSGGEVRVADLRNGMFGGDGRNRRAFDVSDGAAGVVNLAPQYLIWMAMEGTRINIPPQAERFLGKHKAQMLRQIKDRCARFIPSSPKASKPHFNDHEIFRDICLHDNLPVDAPEIQYDPATELPVDGVAQDRWLDKGALNAGWAIYRHLEKSATQGQWPARQNECEKVYPR